MLGVATVEARRVEAATDAQLVRARRFGRRRHALKRTARRQGYRERARQYAQLVVARRPGRHSHALRRTAWRRPWAAAKRLLLSDTACDTHRLVHRRSGEFTGVCCGGKSLAVRETLFQLAAHDGTSLQTMSRARLCQQVMEARSLGAPTWLAEAVALA